MGHHCICRQMHFPLYLLQKINLNVHFVSDITTPSIVCINQLLTYLTKFVTNISHVS